MPVCESLHFFELCLLTLLDGQDLVDFLVILDVEDGELGQDPAAAALAQLVLNARQDEVEELLDDFVALTVIGHRHLLFEFAAVLDVTLDDALAGRVQVRHEPADVRIDHLGSVAVLGDVLPPERVELREVVGQVAEENVVAAGD